jgi:hypothetical protein
LGAIDHLGAVITGVSDAVLVFIELIGVGQLRTIIIDAAERVTVTV